MGPLFGVLGAAALLAVLLDVVKTTLVPRGAGFLSAPLVGLLWRAAIALHRRRPGHRALSYAGAVIMLVTVGVWATLAWLGATLLFLADTEAVVRASTGVPADLWDRAYFAGYSLITLGIGDFRPAGVVPQLLTVVLSGFGFFLFTLSITYLLSVLSAVTHKRQVASYLAALGLTPQAIVLRSWRDGGCASLVEHRTTLMASIGQLTQQHLAYPALHYFHAGDPRAAFPPRLAALDEALALVEHGLEGCEDAARDLAPLRDTIADFLASLEELYLDPSSEGAPPPPDLGALRAAGLPVRSEEAFTRLLARAGERRRLMRGLVRSDGWSWEDLAPAEARTGLGMAEPPAARRP